MSEPRDYRPTVFLPKTDFPMKAGLPEKEPGIAARWEAEGLYQQVRQARAGREKFILHDGPPYANGDMHIGHALNHVLKDMVVRTQTLLGKDAPYVPGWDCHGLPIEWKVEEQYRKKKLDKDQVPVREFRAECRAYAQAWVDVQRAQLKRLGIGGDWDNPYLTMQFDSEATIVSELLKFAGTGQLYRGAKPVMWSPVEKTALAEAEIEYEDVVSTQVDVAFEITESPIPELVGAHAVIWTTTPWTIPVNQALAYGPEIRYVLVRSSLDMKLPDTGELQRLQLEKTRGKSFLVAKELMREFERRLTKDFHFGPAQEGLFSLEVLWAGLGSDLAGTVARHPIYNYLRHSREGGNPVPASQLGPRLRGDDEGGGGDDEGRGGDDETWESALEFYARPRPFLPGEFVTTDSGTGLVHMAPDHGEDDFELCRHYGLMPQFVVEADGRYRAGWPWLPRTDERSMSVINAKFNAPDGPVCADLRAAGALLSASTDYPHSYPHSWRSKAKVIFRCTPQWFVPMDHPLDRQIPLCDAEEAIRSEQGRNHTLRGIALAEIDRVRFVPEKGRNRIGSMVEGRPDWVLSRQRAWGVPITLFVDKHSGQYLVDAEVNQRIVAAVRAEGVDAWSDEAAQALLGPNYKAEDYERIVDILDVWFDSGSTHAFVLESGRWPDLRWPADLYLEGSDQHRGWFQSSLLESCATRGRAPYDAVLTHGFTMASDGKKMSKSLGNTVDPNKVMETYGADIIRLWALTVDFTEDHRIGDEILKGVSDQYRKLRNTFRYLLGALDGFDEAERVGPAEMPELERYVLALLGDLDAGLREAVAEFDFNAYVRALTEFCNEDLSAFFFDIRKDSLYCDAPGDPRRRACRSVLDTLFHALVRYAAPVLVFTSEEVWSTRYPDAGSVHLLEWPEIPQVEDPSEARDIDGLTNLGRTWQRLRAYRSLVTEAIEPLRRTKVIGSSLEAEIQFSFVQCHDIENMAPAELEELCITSSVTWTHVNATNVAPEGSPPQLVPHFPDGAVVGVNGQIGVIVARSSHHKCGRCWRLLPEVPEDGALCARCTEVVLRQAQDDRKTEMDQPA